MIVEMNRIFTAVLLGLLVVPGAGNQSLFAQPPTDKSEKTIVTTLERVGNEYIAREATDEEVAGVELTNSMSAEDALLFANALPSVNPSDLAENSNLAILAHLYIETPSLMNVLKQEKRLAGKGWKIEEVDRKAILKTIREIEVSRKSTLESTKGMFKGFNDAWWESHLRGFVADESKIAKVFSECLPPKERVMFFREHKNDILFDCIVVSIMGGALEADTKLMDMAFERRITSIQERLIDYFNDFKNERRSTFTYQYKELQNALTPYQVSLYQEILGNKDPNISSDEYFNSLSDEKLQRMAIYYASLKKLVSERKSLNTN